MSVLINTKLTSFLAPPWGGWGVKTPGGLGGKKE